MSMPRCSTASTIVAALLCISCGPKVEESHRHLAAEWCREWTDFREQCSHGGPFEFSEQGKLESRAKCESDAAWDWTDRCGELKWEYHQCLSSLSCEEYQVRDNPETPAAARPCHEAERAFYDAPCQYYDESGNPIDHGG